MTTRILYVADSLMAGGIESQLVALALGLDRAHFEPHVLSLYGPTARDTHFAPELRAANIPLYLPDLGWGARDKVRGITTIVHVARSLHPQIIQAEGYHANLLTRLASPLMPRSCRLLGTLRGVHTAKQMLYERLSAWTCARIIANAPHLAADLAQRGHVPRDKIDFIPNGIDVARFAQPHDARLRQSLAPEARRVFVSLGRISYEKNMHWLAEAFGLLKERGLLADDARLFIVGPPHHPQAQAQLEAAIARGGLQDVVLQRPSTVYPEDYYAAADAVILFSPNEGMPNVPIEALAAGKPVIISTSANAAGVIEHDVTGWVVPTGDISALADTLLRVMRTSDVTLATMAVACRERAASYSVARLVERYSALYQKLAPSTPVSGGQSTTP